jgi:hypothetical protein
MDGFATRRRSRSGKDKSGRWTSPSTPGITAGRQRLFDDLARDAETGWDRERTWWDPEFHALGLTARADGQLVTFAVELRFPPSREERVRESISVTTSRVGRVGVDIRKFLNLV